MYWYGNLLPFTQYSPLLVLLDEVRPLAPPPLNFKVQSPICPTVITDSNASGHMSSATQNITARKRRKKKITAQNAGPLLCLEIRGSLQFKNSFYCSSSHNELLWSHNYPLFNFFCLLEKADIQSHTFGGSGNMRLWFLPEKTQTSERTTKQMQHIQIPNVKIFQRHDVERIILYAWPIVS